MKKQGIKKGDRVGIVGLGGLGVMGVKIATALGATVTVISRGRSKEELARRIGAENYVAMAEKESVEKGKDSLDLIINTVPSYHDYSAYKVLLDKESKISRMVMLGLHEGIASGMLLDKVTCGNSRIMSSGIGGIRATQEVMDLCAEHEIYPELEVVGCDKINWIYQQLENSNDSGKRYVLDIATLKEGLVSSDPAPTLSDGHDMKIGGILGVFLRDLFLFRWW